MNKIHRNVEVRQWRSCLRHMQQLALHRGSDVSAATLRWILFITWRTFGGSFAAVWIATIASKVTFYSIFQALQDKQTFAPLTFQNFQIFAHVGDFCRFFQNVAEISLKSQIFRWNFHWFLSEFREIADNCRKSLSFAPISRNSRENGAKVHQFLMNKFINSSKFGDELLFISNLAVRIFLMAWRRRRPAFFFSAASAYVAMNFNHHLTSFRRIILRCMDNYDSEPSLIFQH